MDRITKIRIEGFRVLRDVCLDLDELTVLIGDNGTGKSTFLDAFEILRMVGRPETKVHDVAKRYDGMLDMLTHGEDQLRIEVELTNEEATHRVCVRNWANWQ